MRTLYILPIEPIENRYPGDWHLHIPSQFENYIDCVCEDVEVMTINGTMNDSNSGSSAFLNFIDTNVWKSSQMESVAKLFANDSIHDGDIFLITDAWNPAVHQLRYMADLTGKKIKIVGIWHAGSYDKWDILGQTFKNKKWSYANEAAMYEAFDTNIFATHFHKKMFFDVLTSSGLKLTHYKAKVCGFPMEYMRNIKVDSSNSERKNRVIFPHRASPEKQHDIADDFAEVLDKRGIELYSCQGKGLTRDEYFARLSESKVCFSCSWQETLGIAQYEAMSLGAIPMVPNRLAYTEMYPNYSLYPSMWTENFNTYRYWRNKLADMAENFIDDYEKLANKVHEDAQTIGQNFFTGTQFYGIVLDRRLN